MRISLQIAIGYFLTVGLAAYFVLNIFSEQVKPGVSEAMEDTLVDTANLLAELAAKDIKAGRIVGGGLASALQAYSGREVDAAIRGIHKRSLDYRVYVTDAQGIVVYSTEPGQIGRDFSSWRDVYLTLRGQYGARSSKDAPGDANSSVMHVAAPVRDGQRIIGVLTVAKPYVTVQPFVERSQAAIRKRGFLLLGITALIGVVFTWHLTRAIRRLRRYAQSVTEGHKATRPATRAAELDELGRALESMREKLEGKNYVESYIHNLTHELKSPLAAIRGAAELLEENSMPVDERRLFLANIREQSERLREIADKMLQLAQLEQRQSLEQPSLIDLAELTRQAVTAAQPRLQNRSLAITMTASNDIRVKGESFLLRQAIENLLDNAIQFSPRQGKIAVDLSRNETTVRLEIRDQGSGIPDYATSRVFERFFSLPRPDTGRKSTGLGLALAREVAELHGGSAGLGNLSQGGALAWLEFPAA
ncbi:MAG: two-component system sensor histidine kinase CreC [Sulfuricella sp.]|nr:two-component system sensor histidine kinase CreC [Sulfuricella sp.]